MAELTPLDEKLGEVLGLRRRPRSSPRRSSRSRAPRTSGTTWSGCTSRRPRPSAAPATSSMPRGPQDRDPEKARDTKSEGADMMKIYLGGEEEALDGFEFLSMAEAGELCHWEIVARMSKLTHEADVQRLAEWAVGVQREHVERSAAPRSRWPPRRSAPARAPGGERRGGAWSNRGRRAAGPARRVIARVRRGKSPRDLTSHHRSRDEPTAHRHGADRRHQGARDRGEGPPGRGGGPAVAADPQRSGRGASPLGRRRRPRGRPRRPGGRATRRSRSGRWTATGVRR